MSRRRAQDSTGIIAAADALAGRDERPFAVGDRHFVTDAPLEGPYPTQTELAYFAMGCFWGAERLYWQTPGVFVTAVGYAGGHTPHPTYEEVCSGRTGHTETVLVVFDPAVVSYDELLAIFWENHDPTQGMRQGNDIGTQYRSAIFATTDRQADAARRSAEHYQQRLAEAGFATITTEVLGAPTFYFAEDYHQQYLAKNPGGYCNHGFCQVAYADA